MKKCISFFTAILVLLSFAIVLTSCSKKDENGIIFKKNDKNEYTVIGYDGDESTVVIPEEFKELPVKSIGEHAFDGNKTIKRVSIPDSVTIIGEYTFSLCENLKKINIPDSVTTIGEHAFSYCYELESIELGDAVKRIGGGAFLGCESLKSIVIPISVIEIGKSAFLGSIDSGIVYYKGTPDDWSQISIHSANTTLNHTDIYYSLTRPASYGSYWRYVNGVPTVWE